MVAETGTHVLSSDSPLGPYAPDGDAFLVGGAAARFYAGRLVQHEGRWHLLAWSHRGDDDEFVGALSDPMPLTVGRDGRLAVQLPALARGPTA